MIPDFIKKDNYLTGLLLGVAAPIIFYGLLYLIDMLLYSFAGVHLTPEYHYLYLLSMAFNIILFRYYFVSLKAEKTGKGILLVTIIYIMVYFFLFFKQ
jgi:hypothetical protein